MSTLGIVLIFVGFMIMVAAIPIVDSAGILITGVAVVLIGTVITVVEIESEANECEAAGGIYSNGDCFRSDSVIELHGMR